jgi:vacuolar-type H+-ATPase subunit D/Vma8
MQISATKITINNIHKHIKQLHSTKETPEQKPPTLMKRYFKIYLSKTKFLQNISISLHAVFAADAHLA